MCYLPPCVALLLNLTFIHLPLQFWKVLPKVCHGVLKSVDCLFSDYGMKRIKLHLYHVDVPLSIRLPTLQFTGGLCMRGRTQRTRNSLRGGQRSVLLKGVLYRGGLSLRGQDVTAGRDQRAVSFVQLFQLRL